MNQLDWWTLFWGGFLILYGVSFLIKSFFGISIPIIKPLIGVFLIYIGFVVLTGYDPACSNGSKLREGCYNIFFGQQYIDLSGIEVGNERKKVDINVAFGSAQVKVNPRIPMKINARAIFGTVEFPDENSIAMGQHTKVYNGPLDEGYLDISAQVKFGNIEFSDSE